MFFQRMSSGGSSGNISVALQSLQRCVLCPVDMLLDSMEAISRAKYIRAVTTRHASSSESTSAGCVDPRRME